MERSEGDMSLKNPVTPPGIDPGTVRLVAQRLNHYAIPGPCVSLIMDEICSLKNKNFLTNLHVVITQTNDTLMLITVTASKYCVKEIYYKILFFSDRAS
jgi:hypothetical protein